MAACGAGGEQARSGRFIRSSDGMVCRSRTIAILSAWALTAAAQLVPGLILRSPWCSHGSICRRWGGC